VFSIQKQFEIPWKIMPLCRKPTKLHRNSSSVLGFKSEPIFSHHFASRPLDLVQITFWSLYFDTKALQTFYLYKLAQRLPKFQFHPPNFFPSYLFNPNFESSDSCARIMRITSCFSSSYSYFHDCCICVIVCLSVR
jgi:hypothetical protein